MKNHSSSPNFGPPSYGWNSNARASLVENLNQLEGSNAELIVGRVKRIERDWDVIITDDGAVNCERRLGSFGDYQEPVVGDWVLISYDATQEPAQPIIAAIAERTNSVVRKKSGPGALRPQAVAANTELIALVVGLDQGVNIPRLVRSVILCLDAAAEPFIVLTKSDQISEKKAAKAITKIESLLTSPRVFLVNSTDQGSLTDLRTMLDTARPFTLALVGASGAGKSTLVNALAETEIETQEVRETDSRGRHTTTFREMHSYGEDSAVIDTPGIRSVGLWQSDDGIEKYFKAIYDSFEHCEYSRCTHTGEQGCGLDKGLASGQFVQKTVDEWRSLLDENQETYGELY